MASHNFNARQSYEREVKDIYSDITINSFTAAEATIDTTEPIVLTKVKLGEVCNGQTFTIQVVAPAANPAATVLAVFTGTAAAIICTVTPNDGTNNTATPVTVTTEELVELINTGLIAGKTPTITDASSLRALQTAAGGDTTPLADAGEGDGEVGTFAGAVDDITVSVDRGISSIVRNDTGDFTITLSNKFASLKYFRMTLNDSTAKDLRAQVHTDSVATDGTIRFMTLTGATKTDPADTNIMKIKLEVKDTASGI